MKKLSLKKEMAKFAEENQEFLNFLYMEGYLEGKKGFASVILNEEQLEPILGGFEESDRKKLNFVELGCNDEEINYPGKMVKGYFQVLNFDGEILWNLKKTIPLKKINMKECETQR